MRTLVISLASLVLCFSGCTLRWQPNVIAAPGVADSNRADPLLDEAESRFVTAGARTEVEACVEAYEQVLTADPANTLALRRLSTLHILIGTAFTEGDRGKREQFFQAMDYATAAMATNPEIGRRLQAGERLWEVADALQEDDVEAAFLWVTALQYDFKEVMSLPSKIINVRWMQRSLQILERISTVAPEFGGGGVDFAKVICYYTLPKWMGGSKPEGERLMQESVARGEGWLLPRWARGKYFYTMQGEHEKARADLEWVAAQDPSAFKDPHPWGIHFLEDVHRLLE